MPRLSPDPLFALFLGATTALLLAAPAVAFETPGHATPFSDFDLPAHLLPAAQEILAWDGMRATTELPAWAQEFRFDGLDDRLRRLPLRPVAIGTIPRLPSDPDLGVGIVLRFPLSL